MKKYILLFLVISILFLAGCSENVDNSVNKDNNVNENIEINEDKNISPEQEDKVLGLNSEIVKEYLKIIEQYKNYEYATSEIKYDLIYFNNDDVLDLVVGEQGYWVSVYLYDNGQVYNPVYEWPYGAMGNAGYDYIEKCGVILNYNSDYAGVIGTTAAFILNSNFEFDTLSATRLLDEFLDENDEMYSDILNAYNEYGGFYYNVTKITEEEYNEKMNMLLQNNEAEPNPLMATKLNLEILSLLEPVLNKEQEYNGNYTEITEELHPLTAFHVVNAIENEDTYTLKGVIYTHYTFTEEELKNIENKGYLEIDGKTYFLKVPEDDYALYELYEEGQSYPLYTIKKEMYKQSPGEPSYYFLDREAQISVAYKITEEHKQITVDKNILCENVQTGELRTVEQEFLEYKGSIPTNSTFPIPLYYFTFENGKCIRINANWGV